MKFFFKLMTSIDDNFVNRRLLFNKTETQFSWACQFCSKETIQYLIENCKADIHKLSKNGENGFLCTVRGEQVETMRLLHSIDPSLCKGKDKDGRTALMYASAEGSIGTIKVLIDEFDADVNEVDVNGRNCFHYAVVHGKIENMKFLHLFDPNLCKSKDKYGRTALMNASRYNSTKIVKILVNDFNANINEVDLNGMNCFDHAVACDKVDNMKFLHSIDASLCKRKDDNGKTVLMEASAKSSRESLKVLVNDFGADINEVDVDGRNCLYYAVDHGKIDNMKFLYSINPFLCQSKDKDGQTVLMVASRYTRNCRTAVMRTLLNDCDADINEVKSSFQRAVVNNNISNMKFLNSIDPDLCKGKDRNGKTVLMEASRSSSTETVKVLINDFKADGNEVDSDGLNCLHYAVSFDKVANIKFLLSVNAGLCKVKYKHGKTVLMEASAKSSREIVKILINDFDADVNEVDDKGRTCFHHAVFGKKKTNLKFLHTVDNKLHERKDKDGKNAFDLASTEIKQFMYDELKISSYMTEWESAILKKNKNAMISLIDTPMPQNIPISSLKIQDDCIICYDEKPTVAIFPCRHVCVCKDCFVAGFSQIQDAYFEQLEKCAYCRQKIENVYKLENQID